PDRADGHLHRLQRRRRGPRGRARAGGAADRGGTGDSDRPARLGRAGGLVSAGLQARVRVRQGEVLLDAGIEVARGGVLAVVGPNGSGKSTLLRCIAGLTRPEEARIQLAGRRVTDTAAGMHVPAAQRRIGLLAQEARLFPHLSVLENVAFGPRSNGYRAGAARRRASTWMA